MKKYFSFKLLVFLLVCFTASASLSATKPLETNELVVYTWANYIPQEIFDLFTQETGIRIVNPIFASNDIMYAKLKRNVENYDIVLPSTYFVEQMIKEGLLHKLDHSKISNIKNIDNELLNQPYDIGNVYSIPFMWGATGLMYNKKYVGSTEIHRWTDLLRPEFVGKVIMSDDMRDSMGVALKACGYSANSVNHAELDQAFEFLKKLKPSVFTFDMTTSRYAFVNEEAHIGLIWSGDAIIAVRENPDLHFVFPTEGVLLWVDSLSIAVNSKNKDNAYKFINFMLRPDVVKMCVAVFPYSTPNLAAKRILPDELKQNRVLNPAPEDLNNSEFILGVGNSLPLYENLWSKFRRMR